MRCVKTYLMKLAFAIFLCLQFGFVLAKPALIYPEVGFLVVAPDRGFLGNEEVTLQ